MGKYIDAFYSDIDRLLGELKKVNAVLKKDADDKKALKKKEDLAPFLTEIALKKRQELAAKLDLQQLGTIIKDGGLPW